MYFSDEYFWNICNLLEGILCIVLAVVESGGQNIAIICQQN
jgi:hypothetical protein